MGTRAQRSSKVTTDPDGTRNFPDHRLPSLSLRTFKSPCNGISRLFLEGYYTMLDNVTPLEKDSGLAGPVQD